MVEGKSWARQAIATADLANRNSVSDGVRVSERSKAKSSAAKMSPERYGVALHILERSEIALADSIKASNLIGCVLEEEFWEGLCLDGKVCRITSVTKCRSEAEFTLGITMVSICGALS